MEAVIESRFGTKSRADVFAELCRIVLHEEHEFREATEEEAAELAYHGEPVADFDAKKQDPKKARSFGPCIYPVEIKEDKDAEV